jgi:hypothetical protein
VEIMLCGLGGIGITLVQVDSPLRRLEDTVFCLRTAD